MEKIIELRNTKHMGDCIYSVIILNKLAHILDADNVVIHLYINDEYIKKVQDFIQTKRITLWSGESTGLDLWIGNTEFSNNWFNLATQMFSHQVTLDQYYVNFANEIYQKLNFSLVIDKIEYEDPDLLERYQRLPDKYKDVDYFFINSHPLSRQYCYNLRRWNNKIRELSTKYKVVTTLPVRGITCVDDDHLTIKDMASLSTHAKNIVAISTGPLVGCINTYTINNVKRCLVYSRDGTDAFSYPSFKIGTNDFFNRGQI